MGILTNLGSSIEYQVYERPKSAPWGLRAGRGLFRATYRESGCGGMVTTLSSTMCRAARKHTASKALAPGAQSIDPRAACGTKTRRACSVSIIHGLGERQLRWHSTTGCRYTNPARTSSAGNTECGACGFCRSCQRLPDDYGAAIHEPCQASAAALLLQADPVSPPALIQTLLQCQSVPSASSPSTSPSACLAPTPSAAHASWSIVRTRRPTR
jgi:hypothetical protein